MSSKSRNLKKLALVAGLCVFAGFLQTVTFKGERDLSEEEWKGGERYLEIHDTTKPTMATFYESVPGGCCSMTTKGHENLIDAWRQAWHDKGWNTVILTKDDAKKHPDFDALNKKLASIDVDPYNRRCYWRWLAMASDWDGNGGGGWMSDYDLMPLALTAEKGVSIAQDEGFKTFGNVVPCMIHASREEWDRVIHLMIDHLPKKKQRWAVISDMNSFIGIKWTAKDIQWKDELLRRWPYKKDDDGVLKVNCKDTNTALGVHLSHYGTSESFKIGHYPTFVDGKKIKNVSMALERRGGAAKILMKEVQEQCAELESNEIEISDKK